MTKPQLVKVEALFYVLQQVIKRSCAYFDTAPLFLSDFLMFLSDFLMSLSDSVMLLSDIYTSRRGACDYIWTF